MSHWPIKHLHKTFRSIGRLLWTSAHRGKKNIHKSDYWLAVSSRSFFLKWNGFSFVYTSCPHSCSQILSVKCFWLLAKGKERHASQTMESSAKAPVLCWVRIDTCARFLYYSLCFDWSLFNLEIYFTILKITLSVADSSSDAFVNRVGHPDADSLTAQALFKVVK